MKASHGTAGQSVRQVSNTDEERAAIEQLGQGSQMVIGQAPAGGEYGQVHALFTIGVSLPRTPRSKSEPVLAGPPPHA